MDADISEIVPGLFVGNAKSALQHAAFDMVVNCTCSWCTTNNRRTS